LASHSQKRNQDKESQSRIISENLGQILITMAQIEWTRQVRDALRDMQDKSGEGGNAAMRKVKKTWLQKTTLLVECVEKQGLSRRDRDKIVSLIIIEEHNRQVIEAIAANKGCNNVGHFDWQSQLRFERSESIDQQSDMM
jgi:hypothetical protein